ncbi:DUF3224 domain-containing protein [Saccharothrix algeriensis]|uniref:DUF3224 domain-containing protein n=1 Tax=Saccharothrix algeriensis TaxID=173560 RepID=A0A8T8I4C8_9PSEU|nr:DUF3224 domain-containing protein [Saccharothrix algeriensis]MBM7811413.1 hypothetical protein [Saccharothrix algeriensis]QTR05280.1 DUF3224 domain-containing protein [Saccharothrix algeriensis]
MELQSPFTITRWDEKSTDGTEPQFGRVQVDKTYTGVMDGTSTAELTTCQPVEGSAGYVAIEKFRGTLEGRSGAFAFQHGATISPAGPDFYGRIIPGSGTGELVGITGTVKLEHELITLDYSLG